MFSLNDTQKSIIAYLFRSNLTSHTVLSNVTHLSKPGITLTIQPLLKEGILEKETPKQTGKIGRREDLLRLNPRYGTFFGIDVRKHYYYLSAIDFAGNALGTICCHNDTELINAIWDKMTEHLNVLGMAVTIRDFTTLEEYTAQHEDFISLMESFHVPVIFLNNVEALAYVHKLYYPEDNTFLLVKYGPTIGSSIFANGSPVGPGTQIGKVIVEGRTLEETIDFESLFGEELEEKDGAERLLKDEEKLKPVMHALAVVMVNANHLLNLDRVIFAGRVLSDKHAQDILTKEIHGIEKDAPTDKARLYQDYEHLNEYKAALMALIAYTLIERKD